VRHRKVEWPRVTTRSRDNIVQVEFGQCTAQVLPKLDIYYTNHK